MVVAVLLVVVLGVGSIIGSIVKALRDTPEKKEARKQRRRQKEERRKEERARLRHEAARRELAEIEQSASTIKGSVLARELAEMFMRTPPSGGKEFERFCKVLFIALGYSTSSVGGSGDQGVDLLLRSEDEKVAVQCKNHAKPVGNRAVQEVFAGARYYGASGAWVVAPMGFTRGAVQLAERLEVWLVDKHGILRLIEQARSAAASGNGRGIPDRKLYTLLLKQYRLYADLAKRADEERRRGEGNPDVERQYEQTMETVYANMGEVLEKLDAIERRNRKMLKVDSAERQAWQAEIKKAAL